MEKEIIYFEQKVKVICDEKCEKAWGISNRPRIQLDKNNDDYVYLSDTELGIAPMNPGTYEGEDRKPTTKEERLNKWFCRKCERCNMSKLNDFYKPIIHKDFSVRVYNILKKDKE